MNISPRQLRIVISLAETRSFTGAAAQLGLSQPTVSQQIRKLEIASGRQLVARDTREVRLTDNGDAMRLAPRRHGTTVSPGGGPRRG